MPSNRRPNAGLRALFLFSDTDARMLLLATTSLSATLLLSTSDHRWAVITGASSGIGEALARRAASRGYNVLLAARRRPQLEALAREVQGDAGVSASVVQCDLSTSEGVRQLCDASDRLDVGLVCLNAGV